MKSTCTASSLVSEYQKLHLMFQSIILYLIYFIDDESLINFNICIYFVFFITNCYGFLIQININYNY